MEKTNFQIIPALIDDVTHNVRQLLTTLLTDGLESNPEELTSEGVEELTGKLFAGAMEAGRLGLQRYIQSFEQDSATIRNEGASWHRSDYSEKIFLTRFGEITLSRGIYYQRNTRGRAIRAKALVPLDRGWGMQGRYATADVVEGVLCASAAMTPGETAEFYARATGITPSPSLIYKIIQEDGKRLREMIAQQPEQRWRETSIPAETEVVVASFDGANVCLREPGAKRGRRIERPRTDGRESAGNDPEASCYRNVMVGAISAYKAKETTDTTGESVWKPERLQSHYLGEMPEQGFGSFREQSIAALEQLRDQIPKEGVTKLLLMDGARNLWNWAQNEPFFEDFDWLVDYYHASEHLMAAAESLFGRQSKEAEDWYARWKRKLKHEENAVDGLIRSIGYHLSRRRLSATRRAGATRERNYFANNRDKMNYAIYVEEGCPIGSGPVEAACKTIVKQRMGRSGMRWNRESGGNILNLRVLTKSGHWDAMWSLYRQQAWPLKTAA